MNEIRVEPRTAAGGARMAQKRPEPCALVIFGASGDLASRKLAPALFDVFREGLLPECFRIIGFARSGLDAAGLRAAWRERALAGADAAATEHWEAFAARIEFLRGDYGEAASYAALRERLAASPAHCGDNRLFYLATPPELQESILSGLREGGLIHAPGAASWSRVIIEKPFGRDLESARRLNALVRGALDESQVYRIDHYLGKETVQNILVFRFGNAIFEPLWNRNHVDHVQITAAESIGTEGRAGFYDRAGVVRDFLQNHLLEVLALVAMEQPVSFAADRIRDEKLKAIRSLRRLEGEEAGRAVVLGQYAGYREEAGVAPDSRTPTYAAARVMVDNWRWQGVPFYLRAGKALARRATEVSLHFRQVPFCLFGEDEVCQRLRPNVLRLRIQPDEGIALEFGCKTPGDGFRVSDVVMDFGYGKAFARRAPEAYARLLVDAMKGDQTLFARSDAVECAWRFVTPALDYFEQNPEAPLHPYAKGSEGPEAARALPAADGRAWDRLG